MKPQTAAVAGLLLLSAGAAQPAVYQCIAADGQVLFTDAGCPSGYTTAHVVPDAPAPSSPPDGRPPAGASSASKPDKDQASKDQPSEAEIASLKAQAETARLRVELEEERLRAIDRKLDALLETPPAYGAVAVAPFGVPPRPFPICKAKKGQQPWVNCRPAPADTKPKVVPRDGPSCGIVGCTPGITGITGRSGR
jgi:hypothetical protein